MNWSDDYAIGTRAVIERHQQMVELLNRLHAVKLDQCEPCVVGSVLDELVDVAMCAFSFEEVELRAGCASDYALHRREHEELVDTLSTLLYEHERSGLSVNVRDMRFVAELFRFHLLDVSRSCGSNEQCLSDAAAAGERCIEGNYARANESPSTSGARLLG